MQHPAKSPLLYATREYLLQFAYGLGTIAVLTALSGIAQVWVAKL